MRKDEAKRLRPIDTPHPAGNDLSRREIGCDLTALNVPFHSGAGLSELALRCRDAREKVGR